MIEEQRLSEHELCPSELLEGQEAAFARDIERLHARADMVRVVCPACGADAPRPAFEKYGFFFQHCGVCATIYMNPRPSEPAMADYYANSENYAFWAQHIFPASEATRREKIHKPWLERIIGYAKQFNVPLGLLIEIGPGFGTFAELARASGQFTRVLAVEPTPELAAACRTRGVEVAEERVEDFAGTGADATVVCAFEVIEHLFEPRRLVEAVHRLLVPGGLMVVSCPNGAGFDIAMLGAGSLAVDMEHVNLFNPDSLRRLVESAGFEVLVVHTPGRLDAEFVREAAVKGEISLDPFLQRVLVTEWARLGWPFQRFLSEHGLSSHMWLAARRRP